MGQVPVRATRAQPVDRCLCSDQDEGVTKPRSPQLLTAAEACDQLGIDRSTLSRWATAGRIAYQLKLPGKRGAYLFTQAQIDAAQATIDAEAAS